MELHNPIYASTCEETTKYPESSFLQSRSCKRAALVTVCAVVTLVALGLIAAVALAFVSINNLEDRIAIVQDSQMPLRNEQLEEFVNNATISKIKQLIEDIDSLNCTVLALHEAIQNREQSRGLPGNLVWSEVRDRWVKWVSPGLSV